MEQIKTKAKSDKKRILLPEGTECVPQGLHSTLPSVFQLVQAAQIQVNTGSWTELVFDEIGSATFAPTDNPAGWGWTFGSRCLTCTLTQDIINTILANRSDFEDEGAVDCGIILQGDGGNTFAKVTITK